MGAGPALAGLECPDFDPAYARGIYSQYATIIAVTDFGMQRVTDKNLRNISGEIRDRLTSANQKLAVAYSSCGCLTADTTRAQAIIADLCKETASCFDVTYAKTLSALIKQATPADELAGTKSLNSAMKDQAQFMTGVESDWAMRLDRWVTDHGYTA
ncbi:MAG: hypothetical protein M1133_06885 [Armatimonadetes bacterium]|nr:hypothetical protein [Armatimonadota bacterium]